MSSFSHDTFTGTDGTDLNAHTGELAATWTRQSGSTSNAAILASNRARASTSNVRCIYYASGTPADADYSVYLDVVVRTNSSTSRAGPAGRMDTAADTSYIARYDGANWNLIKRVAGTQTTLITSAATLTVGNSYTVELRMSGTTISMYVNGSQIGTDQTDSSITAAGHPGVFLNDVSPSDSTGYHVDNFDTDDTPGGGGGSGAVTAYRDATARVRVAATAFRDAVARIRVAATAFKDATIRVRVAATAFRDASVRVRIGATAYRDAVARVRIAATTFRDGSVRARIAATSFRDAAVRIAVATPGATTAYRFVQVRVRIAATGLRDAALRVRLGATAYRDAALRIRTVAPGARDAPIRTRIAASGYRDASVRIAARVLGYRDAPVRLRIIAPGYRMATVRVVIAGPTLAPGRHTPADSALHGHTASDRALYVHTPSSLVGVGG